jgi:hypothetical protein
MRASLALPLLALAIPLIGPALAGDPCQVWTVEPPSPQLDDRFGASLDGIGGTWVVGAPGRQGSGQALVFEATLASAVQSAVLWPSDVFLQDAFGAAVALDGDTIVVGCPGDDDGAFGAGSAYVFERFLGTWIQTAKLQSSTPSLAASFGSSVAIGDDWIAVGAPFDSRAASFGGSLSLFERVGGSWLSRAEVLGAAPNGRLGTAVSIQADRLAVGEPGRSSGHVRVLERSAGVWTEQADLTPTGASAQAEFGAALDLAGGTLLVGARSDAVVAEAAGSAYLFGLSAGTWQLHQRLELPSPKAGDRFGDAVDLYGPRALIGAPGEDGASPNAGCAHVFERSLVIGPGGFPIWKGSAAFGALGGESGANFGAALALDADNMMVAAPQEDTVAKDAGRVTGMSFERLSCAPLSVGPLEVSASVPERLEFALHADPVLAGKPFFLLASSAGSSPGIWVGGQLLPLNLLDGGYGDLVLFGAGLSGPISNVGLLDAQGNGKASIDLTVIAAPITQGMTLHHAYFVFDGGLALYASPAVAVDVIF